MPGGNSSMAEVGNTSLFGLHDINSKIFHLGEIMAPPQYTVPIYGYISPLLVIFTIITNILVCVVLLRKNMRSPTNSLLVAMALSDMFTGVFPVPAFFYFYTLGYWKDYVPFHWCYFYRIIVEYIPTIFHTASIWLTLYLAGQRYIYVCHSLKAKQWCTIPNVIKGVLIIYFVAILTQAMRFFEFRYTECEYPSRLYKGENITACLVNYYDWLKPPQILNLYYNVYFWFRVVFIHIIPCAALVVLNALLINAMHEAQKRRQMLLKQNKKNECKRIKESNCTTLMLVAVVGLFLLVELPLGITFIMHIIENTFNVSLFEENTQDIVSLVINLFILLSYPMNFFIYCGMSRQFRTTFKRLFIKGSSPLDREHSQYMTLNATENGRTNETTM